MEGIITAFITGGLALIGVIISNKSSENRIQQQILIHQAVTDTKLEELTREVRLHNNFAERVPLVEREIEHLEQDIKDLKEHHK